ncbi:MAG TPA: OmpA family protein [Kofleriaceae bacterium]|nr:OmpA family protein [Kofleriaceae bacterium]
MAASHNENESGISVYPPLPMPMRPRSDSRDPTVQRAPRAPRARSKGWIPVAVVAVLAGGAAAWFLQPVIAPDARIAASTQRASEAEKAAAAQKERADALEKSLDTTSAARRELEAQLTVAESARAELAGKSADEASQRKAVEQLQGKVKAAIDRSWGAVAVEGSEVHLQISDRTLFRPSDDALTDRGKLVLGKIAGVLKDVPDRLVWVQGHTDDQPVAIPRAAPPPAPARKGARPAPVGAPAPAVRFPTNWELSAARALAVVHYLQDAGKLEPTRLAALAFGQYAPISNKDRAANRRIEIVLVARRPPAK